MCSESLPKEFEKTSDVLPFTKYGLSTINDFKKASDDVKNLELLKQINLTEDEIKLYLDNEAGLLEQHSKIESGVLKTKLKDIYKKIESFHNKNESNDVEEEPASSKNNIFERFNGMPIKFYPEGHPMNQLKELEESLFQHLKTDRTPINKRRKILRRLQRKKERILAQGNDLCVPISRDVVENKPGSLWDVKEVPKPEANVKKLIGPKQQTLYTIKDNKIVRLEPVDDQRQDVYRAVDIVMPTNAAESQMLEGTKMLLDDIRKIDRFKDYEPGVPSKILYIKNIAPSVSQEQLSLLFNQFVLANGGPIDVRLMTGRMRGQAFVTFHSEELAIQALDEVNGTILSGRPVIAHFGKNSNRLLDEDA